MKVAALDLGTNTFLCLIAEVQSGQIEKVYDDQVEIVRLGQEVNQTKRFHPDAIKRAEACLKKFSEIIKKHQPEKILAMATSAARDVTNSEELFQLGEKYQIPIEIIPGEKEAEITFRGAISGMQKAQKNLLVLDIGGGSTELILGQKKTVLYGESVNIGCVRLTEMFLKSQPADTKQIDLLQKHILEKLAPVIYEIEQHGGVDEILAVAGTPTELARIEIGTFDVSKIDGFQMSQEWLDQKFSKFSNASVQELIEKHHVTPGRADLITVGVCILKDVCHLLKKKSISVSTRGVRYGVALELAERSS